MVFMVFKNKILWGFMEIFRDSLGFIQILWGVLRFFGLGFFGDFWDQFSDSAGTFQDSF